jgi:serine phosphatase RsbU (regulator of sigma subunit)
MNRNDELFGLDGLKKAVAPVGEGPARVGEAIIRAVRAHAGLRPQNDDIAVVCFGRK